MKALKKDLKKFTLFDNSDKYEFGGNIVYIVSFVIPVLIFIALYYTKDIFPFGEECYLRSDMYHQYAPFFSELWHKIRTGGSLLYSWDIGMGTNFVALYAYYLASPANWIIALFPQKYMIEIMNALIILKLAGSSLSLTYYISKHFNTKSLSIAVFGFFYAFSGYVAAYSWNIMWLDCIILLPLIMLGLERLVNENKGFLYCLSLGLCIFTNYYISIMICISCVIYFIVLMIAYNGRKSPVIYLKKFLNFSLFSLLAGGLAACLLLPELYAFSLSASSNITFPKTLTNYFSILNMLSRHFIDVPVHLGLEHFPNIYCGVFIFLLIPLYVMDKKTDKKEKIGKMIILLIFLTSYNLNIPNFIWHGFHYPNSLPCRQSFIYIFFVITMCYEAFSHIKENSGKKLTAALWIAIGIVLVAEQTFVSDQTYNFKVLYISGAFILVYAFLIYLQLHTNWKIPVVLFLVFLTSIIECTINMDTTGISTTNRTNYLKDYDAVKTVINKVAADDDSFYRMDKLSGLRSKNDGAWHNYRSISTFSSTSSGKMTNFLGYLGFEHSMNAYGCNGATLVTNSLFSIKYNISNQLMVEDSLTGLYTSNNGEFIYKNNYTLPIGYMTYNDIYSWNPVQTNYNGIKNQNTLIETLTGVSDLFQLAYEDKENAYVSFTPPAQGHMYLIVKNTECDYASVKINDADRFYFSDLKNDNHILNIGYVTANDSVEISAECAMNLEAYMLDTSKFIEAYNILNSQSFQVEKFSDTRISGKVNASKDAALLFSIPYDNGWSVYIDGKKTKLKSLCNALILINVPAGEHEITLKYMPVNFIRGTLITLLCIIILICLYVFNRKKRRQIIDDAKLPPLLLELLDENDVIYMKKKKIFEQDDNFEDFGFNEQDNNFEDSGFYEQDNDFEDSGFNEQDNDFEDSSFNEQEAYTNTLSSEEEDKS